MHDIDYSKSIIKFNFGTITYFSLWGEDRESNNDDKFLTHHGKILLFLNQESLTSYVLETNNCFFDKKNTQKWIKLISTKFMN